ncbi:MAG TPA: sulfatase-like hydrolase/transferase, partial [Verrucomicrobiales bacterium]|nr:sulfatase-like hydrolase/transferase [Verrucomicrobiales bacterium]
MLLRFLVFLFVIGRAAGAQKAPPNIVMIISDDHAWTDYGFMGHPHIKTPNLDKLASQSLAFRRGYVPSSLCCPSLASLLTGLYPHQHRITS